MFIRLYMQTLIGYNMVEGYERWRVIVITCWTRFQSAQFYYEVDMSVDVSINDIVLSQHNKKCY